MSKSFFEVKNLSNSEGEIRIYGEITKYAWEELGETSAVLFSRELDKLKDIENISLKINSPGGDVYEALAMYHEIKRLSQTKNITAYVDGMAASAATLLAIAANKTVIGKGCYFMIHNPMTSLCYANSQELEEAKKHLEKTKENIIDLYIEKTKLSREEVSKKMDDTTWFTAEEALQAGFVDEIANYDTSIVNLNIFNVFSENLKLKAPKNLLDVINNSKKINKEEKMTLEELKIKYPEAFNQYKNEVINSIKDTDVVKKTIDSAVNSAILSERERIKSLDNLKTFSQEAKDLVNKAKYEEPRDYRDIVVDLYNMSSEQAGREIGLEEKEKKDNGIYDIYSGSLGSSEEQLQNNIVNAALKELGIK